MFSSSPLMKRISYAAALRGKQRSLKNNMLQTAKVYNKELKDVYSRQNEADKSAAALHNDLKNGRPEDGVSTLKDLIHKEICDVLLDNDEATWIKNELGESHISGLRLSSPQDYALLFRAITGVDPGNAPVMSVYETDQIDLDILDEDKIILWRIRFHCTAFDYHGGDSFCHCCEARDARQRYLRCRAIETAARLYQSHMKRTRGEMPEYWSALLHARDFLARLGLDLMDILAEVESVKQPTARTAFSATETLLTVSEEQSKQLSTLLKQEVNTINEQVILSHDTEVTAPADTSDTSSIESCRVEGSSARYGTMQPCELEPARAIEDIETTKLPDPTEHSEDSGKALQDTCSAATIDQPLSVSASIAAGVDTTESEALKSGKFTPSLKSDTSGENKTGRPPRKKAKKKKSKAIEDQQCSLKLNDWHITKHDGHVEHPFHLISGETLIYTRVYDIPQNIFSHGREVRSRVEGYHAKYIDICTAETSKAELQAMEPCWDVEFDIRCIDHYLAQVYYEQKTLGSRLISINEMKAQPMNGVTNERVRLSLGQITAREHVKVALAEDKLAKEARVHKLRTALFALLDFTTQQFWERYHLVPDERIEQLDLLKRKINGLGARFTLPGYPRKLGEGFFEVFNNMQRGLLQQRDQTDQSGYFLLDKNNYNAFQEQKHLEQVLSLSPREVDKVNPILSFLSPQAVGL